MSSRRLATPREQIPPISTFPQGSAVPSSPPPPYTVQDQSRAPRRFIPQDPRDNTSSPPPWPMTVPIIVITQADATCSFKLCDRHTTDMAVDGLAVILARTGRQNIAQPINADRNHVQLQDSPVPRDPSAHSTLVGIRGVQKAARVGLNSAENIPARPEAVLAAPRRPVGDCQKGQVGRSRYCSAHKCARDGCPLIRKRGLRHCAEHKVPSHEQFTPGLPPLHEEIPNSSADIHDAHRLRPRKPMPVRRSSHACQRPGCPSPALSRTCAADDCRQPPSRGAYCARHECGLAGCANARFWTDDRGAYGEHAACRFHTCAARGCSEATPRLGGACGRHAGCGWEGCARARRRGRRYCEAHACQDGDCPAPRVPAGVYCAEHACRGEVPCPRKAEGERGYCAWHGCYQEDCGLEGGLGRSSRGEHRYARDASPFYAVAGRRRFVVPLR
ncbi:hypothetical protein F4810DRAFT_718262 [Camillea tinctor]|nr:hypothetical protein F4810DRAFT_718262 [Camillea tinctor]